MKQVHVCFLWHMHQPYYTDPVNRTASMPWVRLHAIKAYYDMAYLLEQYPAVHSTVNFTPSLLRQLQEIGEGTVRDLFLDHADRPAADLTPEEKAFLVRYFFAANWATMVRPYPRYHELLVKRGLHISPQDLPRVARQFTTQELLDLQVWHNLAWFGYGAVHRYPRLGALRIKNRGFTEEDKQEVLALQRVAVQEIIPRYRRLAEREQIELTTTPFFHPILPLVIDTEINRRARPDLPLPSRFKAPDDAEIQLQRAVQFHTEAFGRAPRGLWPSEGSVCPEVVPLVQRAGLRWLATDEGILARSLHLSGRGWDRHRDLYQPYRLGDGEQPVAIVFRDRELSDAFGFVYHKTTPESAAEDVHRRLGEVIRHAPQEHMMIAIILDGENPWEHYHDGGERFLSLLYDELTRHSHDQSGVVRIHASTISEALAVMPPAQPLAALHSGSWINQDFKIWIGHQEDNRGWDLLGTTRAKLLDISPSLSPAQANAAWDELYAAEGSDWFWWYGDDFDTEFKPEFDRLFRTHVRNVWLHMGLTPPELLNQPICAVAPHLEAEGVTQPHTLLTALVDGLVTSFFEWRGSGSIPTQPPLGAMWKADVLFTAIRFGWDYEHLYLRLDPDETSQDRQPHLQADLTFQTLKDAFRLSLPLHGPLDRFAVWQSTGQDSWQETGCYNSCRRNKIVEVALPWKALDLEPGQEARLSIVVMEHGLEVARYPPQRPAVLTMPGPDFEARLWRV
jgi:alpha-amylase/alpha-mannosidase (GH57 family)